MKPLRSEFIVVGVVEGQDGLFPGRYCSLIGRCGDVPIAKGETFSAVYHYEPRRYPDELGDEPIRDGENPVSLEVIAIQTHNRTFDQLGQGMTGTLVVRGEGLGRLAPGWVIGHPLSAGSNNVSPFKTLESAPVSLKS